MRKIFYSLIFIMQEIKNQTEVYSFEMEKFKIKFSKFDNSYNFQESFVDLNCKRNEEKLQNNLSTFCLENL